MPTPRTATYALAGLLAAGVLAGCAPEPEPEPTPLFASEEEAFAAAEEIFHEYNSALISWRFDGSGSDPLEFVTGAAYEEDLDTLRHLEANGLHFVGESRVSSFQWTDSDLESTTPQVVAFACVDNSLVRVVNLDGDDVTPVIRDGIAAFKITFIMLEDGWRISHSQQQESGTC